MSNIKSSRLVKKDIGDHLMSLLETDRIDQREKILKQEVTDLQTKADRLKKRRDNLRKDLIRNINTNKNDSKGHVHQPIKVSLIIDPGSIRALFEAFKCTVLLNSPQILTFSLLLKIFIA